MGNSPSIVLASTSKYRRELLNKLGIPFTQIDPAYAEEAVSGEKPGDKALRLAIGKAQAGAARVFETGSIIIGSDQVAACGDRIFSKPGNFSNAKEQLAYCSNQWVTFYTGIALVDSSEHVLECYVDEYALKFRELSESAIETYLALDEPYDCAGSIKAESHGILLFESSRGTDINTLYGLPLMRLTSSLMNLGALKHFK